MTDAQEAGKMASEQPTAAPISQNRLSAMLYRSLERLSLAIEQCEESKPTTKEHHASIWSYLNEAQKDAKLKLKHYANFVAAPTAAPQVREVIVGLQENIEQLCALLLQRTGEDRGKLAAPTAAAGSAPQWSERELSVIKELSAKLDISEAQVLRQGLRLYQLQVEGLIRVVDAHPELKKLVQGEPGGEK